LTAINQGTTENIVNEPRIIEQKITAPPKVLTERVTAEPKVITEKLEIPIR
jgi:hypothetical protein